MLSITKRLTPIRRLESGTRLYLAIGLPLRNREELTNLLQELYQPGNPNFHHFLTPDRFAARFGPSPEDYQKVIDFAKSHRLIVKKTHSNRTLLDVEGSVADIEKAFHVHMLLYHHPGETRTFFAPDVEPSVDLNTPVLAISGLNNYVRPHPLLQWAVPLAVRPLGGGSGGGGGGGSGPYGYYGSDFRVAYVPNTLLDGTGQSVGLFELSGYSSQDISDYESEVGYPYVNLQNIYIDGADGNDTNVNYAVEVTSDIEMTIAMAPGLSNVLVYEGPTPENEPPAIQNSSTTAQINDVLNRMATDDKANQLSCSYAMDINLSTVQIFQQFAAQGQSFFQASGDYGAYPAAIDEPADDPYITVVGGTQLNTDSTGAWTGETVWLTPPNSATYGNTVEWASGGGFSLTYGIPAWQQGISMTDNQGSTTMRNLPDVASVAVNVDVVWGNDYLGGLLGGSFDIPVAGTSLAAPLWAGFMALVNQQAAANGQPPVGFVNPALYAIGKSTNDNACFHDITTGNNMSPSSPTKYSATVGYDLCSGWGTINDPLIDALLAPPTENLVITPPFGFTSSGPGGGPFSVVSQTYTLKNIGTEPLNWNLTNSANWLTVSKTFGTLSPGATSTVTVSLNSAVNNFLIANATANVNFANLTDGTFQNRQFDLYAGNGGFEDGDFTDWNLVGNTNNTIVLAADDVDVAGANALPGQPDELFVHSGLYGAYLGELPPDASLSQSLPTTAGQPYLVSFWWTCVPDENGAATPNDFKAKWNGSTLYAETNLPAFGWTNLQFVVPATTTETTLEFDFNDKPGAFGLDDVTVEPVAPVFQSVALMGGNIKLAWSSFPGVSYQLQSASSLSNPNWTNLSTVTATGNLTSTSEPVGPAPKQFYRVIPLPSP